MCGLVAVISPRIPINQVTLDGMRDKLIHRGPDSFGSQLFADSTVGFAHRRLSILDLSNSANQPMVSENNNSLIFNGEIYNFRQLRDELISEGYSFSSSGDSEVLLRALEFWGEDALPRLNGAFAFCFWDDSAKTLLAARDRFGEKPLFYSHGKSGIVGFASEMKALFRHPQIPCRINFQSLERFAKGTWVEDNRETFFEGVHRVSPGEYMKFNAQGELLESKRYWKPRLKPRKNRETSESLIADFETLLDKSVVDRTVSDVSIGASLSGGLDSSFIVSALTRISPKPSTYSAIFPEDETLSEEREIDSVSEFLDVKPNKIAPQAMDLVADSGRIHWHQEEPFYSASIFLQWSIAKLAKSQGVKVLLEGQGADELLAGYQFHFQQHQLDLIELRGLAHAKEETLKFTSRMYEKAASYKNSDRRFNKSVALNLDQLQEASTNLSAWTQESIYAEIPRIGKAGRLRKIRNEALLFNSLPMLLRYADRNSMAWGVESRLPFLDNNLVDFTLGLPNEALVTNAWQKWILRMAAQGRIPDEVTWRVDKVGYAAPLDEWLRGSLRTWAEERLFSPKLTQLYFYNREQVEVLWHEHQTRTANNSWLLWRWISICEWISLYDTGVWKTI